MPVSHANDAATQAAEGWFLTMLATPDNGATEVVVMRGGVVVGGSFPAHSHDRQEVLVILAGGGRFTIGDATGQVAAGDTVIIPAGQLHTFEATADLDAIAIVPAGTRTFGPDGSLLSR